MPGAYECIPKKQHRSYIISAHKQLVAKFGKRYDKIVAVDDENCSFMKQAIQEGVSRESLILVNFDPIPEIEPGVTFHRSNIYDFPIADYNRIGVVWADECGTNRFKWGSWKRTFGDLEQVPYLFQTNCRWGSTLQGASNSDILKEVKLLHENSGKRSNTEVSLYLGRGSDGPRKPSCAMLFAWSSRKDFEPPSVPLGITTIQPPSQPYQPYRPYRPYQPSSSFAATHVVEKVEKAAPKTADWRRKRKRGRKPYSDEQLKKESFKVKVLFSHEKKPRFYKGIAKKMNDSSGKFRVSFEDGASEVLDIKTMLKRKDGTKIKLLK